MRIAVVGSGIMGACAARELAAQAHDVTLFEQFDVDHDRGSSYGDSRIIRRFYDDPYYTALMPQAYALWHDLERSSGRQLVETLGGLYFGPRGHARLAGAQQGLRSVGADATLIDAPEMRERFPAFRFGDDEVGMVDELAGSLRASLCVRTAVEAARATGARLVVGATVRSLARGRGGGIELDVDGDAHRFERGVLCAGPWSARLVPWMHLPIRVTRQQYVHLTPTSDAALFASGAMPIWIDAATDWYGFPHHGERAGVKIASHVFGATVDPDDVDRTISADDITRTRAYAQRRLPALAGGDVAYAKTCLYSVTPDEDFIVDTVEDVPACAIVAGCSGHAFKFGMLLGALAADLALDRAPRADITRFRRSRFARA